MLKVVKLFFPHKIWIWNVLACVLTVSWVSNQYQFKIATFKNIYFSPSLIYIVNCFSNCIQVLFSFITQSFLSYCYLFLLFFIIKKKKNQNLNKCPTVRISLMWLRWASISVSHIYQSLRGEGKRGFWESKFYTYSDYECNSCQWPLNLFESANS